MTTIERPVEAEIEKFRRDPVDGWTHHVVDLDRGGDVRSRRLTRPITTAERTATVVEVVGDRGRLPAAASAAVALRNLSPRRPHQAAPLSYLNSFGRSWSLFTENDRLEWAELGGERRAGVLHFWFRDVVPGSVAIVSLEVTVASAPGVTGSYEVRSSDAPPRTITVNGYRDETVDIVVRPDDPFAVLVTVDMGPGLTYFAFRSACYLA
jgi:hypothetical protein